MKTYCKLGDRAIIICSLCGNEGRIVRIVADLGAHPVNSNLEYAGQTWHCLEDGQKWGAVSEGSALNCSNGFNSELRMKRLLEDCDMRPLPKIDEPVMELETAE